MPTTQPVRNKHHVRALAEYYLKRGEPRNYLLVIMGVHTALRISDLLRLKWEDVYDFTHNRFHTSITIVEQKTKKQRLIALNKTIITALRLYFHAVQQNTPLFQSRKGGSISRIQAYRLIRAASDALEFHTRISCHSLRKTFGYHAWKNDISPAIIMEIYNHSSFAITRRYLGITQDDKDTAYHKLASIM